MATQIQLGDITVDVVLKDIKNVHLSVHPPTGRVRIAAPRRMNLDTVRVFAISKLGWIKQQQKKMREQERETPREYLDRESHYLWGRRYLLTLVEKDAAPEVQINHSKLILQIRPDAGETRKQEVLDEWYRRQIRIVAAPMIAKWEPMLGVRIAGYFVRKMKTKWGSCNPIRRTVRLNTELAKKPQDCLEYIIVHELVHLLEPTHNDRFVALMNRFMPKWQFHRDMLNRLPLRHEEWWY